MLKEILEDISEEFKQLTPAETKIYSKKALTFFKKYVKKNPYNYDYQLIKLTDWGFWADSGGEAMVTLDEKTLKKIVNTLIKFIPHAPGHFLTELNDMFDFYELD